jgi:Oxygenase domain of the 2OGFeDO superfamily
VARTIRLTWYAPDAWVRSLAGKFLDDCHYELLISGEDADVYKPDGTRLLVFRHKVLPGWACRQAFPALLKAAVPTDNRGTAAGGGWHHTAKQDGTVSRRRRARNVLSGVMGYLDRQGQDRYCRTTAFTGREVGDWVKVQPFILAVNDVFKAHCPERYEAQLRVVSKTEPYYVIPGTVFTTVTVNRNWQTAVHKDQGDLRQGFGVMSVIHAGEYGGGYLCFPKYGVAVDMRSQDVLLADVHEWHGNTPLHGKEGEYERISTVLYYRSKMRHCGTPTQELRRVNTRRHG